MSRPTVPSKYSLVYHPNEKVQELVRSLKSELAREIGWYASKNALAHISIMEFQAVDTEIKILDSRLNRCTAYFSPIACLFTQFNHYPNGAFYLQPDSQAKNSMQQYNQQLQLELQLKKTQQSNDPHLSIARRLSEAQLETAFKILKAPTISTQIDTLALRKLNPERKQYDIVKTYPFLDKADNRDAQLLLF